MFRADDFAPYVYRGDWREMKAHISAVLRGDFPASMLTQSCGVWHRFLPEQLQETPQRDVVQ